MNSDNQEFDYGDVEEEREVFNPDGIMEEKVEMEVQTRKSSRPRRPTQMVSITSNKFFDYDMDDKNRTKARKRQRKGTIDERRLVRQQMMSSHISPVAASRATATASRARGRKAHSPIRTMAERIRRRKRADKMKERQVKARIRAQNKAAQRGQALRETLLRTHISSPRRSPPKRPVRRVRDFAEEEQRREYIRREAESRARILRRDVERRRKARERMARVPPILSMMDDLDLGPSVVSTSPTRSFNLQETLDGMHRLYPRTNRRRATRWAWETKEEAPPLITKEFREMTERFEREKRKDRKRLKDRMRRMATGTGRNIKRVDKKALRKRKQKQKTLIERMKEEKKRARRIGEVGWEGVRRKDTTAIPRIVRITGLGEDISGNPIVHYRAQGGGSSQMSLEKFERDFQTLDEYMKEYDAGLKKKKVRKRNIRGREPPLATSIRTEVSTNNASGFVVGDVVEKAKGTRIGEMVRITKVSGNKVAGVFESDERKVRMQSAKNFKGLIMLTK